MGEKDMQIGELARRTGVGAKTIRFYEEIGLLGKPQRTESGYRLYSDAHVKQIQFILRAKRLGLSLDEIREIMRLREGGQPPCFHVERLLQQRLAELQEVQAELKQLQRDLESALQRTHKALAEISSADYCPVIEHSQAAPSPLPLAQRALKKRPTK